MNTNALNPAAQVVVSIIPIVGIVIGGVVIFFYLLWRHKHITLQIKTGTFRQINFNVEMFSLLTGLLLTAVGVVLTLLFFLLEGISYTLLGGVIPLAIGISLIVFYKLYKSELKKKTERN